MRVAEYLLAGLLFAVAVYWAWRTQRGNTLYLLAGFVTLGAVADSAGFGIKSNAPYTWGLVLLLALSGLLTNRVSARNRQSPENPHS